MLESKFQSELIHKLNTRFPYCIVIKNDPNYIQGIPDLIVLNGDKWVALECKKSKTASHRPNQEWYVERMNSMSYATFVYPENQGEVLDEIQKLFES